jgi:hypothetical protein
MEEKTRYTYMRVHVHVHMHVHKHPKHIHKHTNSKLHNKWYLQQDMRITCLGDRVRERKRWMEGEQKGIMVKKK